MKPSKKRMLNATFESFKVYNTFVNVIIIFYHLFLLASDSFSPTTKKRELFGGHRKSIPH